MSRRKRDDTPFLSLDAFLDIATNVVGILILVAVVTVLGAGNISVSSGASALNPPKPRSSRVLFELKGNEIYLVDEKGNGERVQDAVRRSLGEDAITGDRVASLLVERDVGDRTYRVQAEPQPEGIAWVYTVRADAHGESMTEIGDESSKFRRTLENLDPGSFVYFVVHDDSFDMFKKVRELASEKGVAIGWHPVEGAEPLKLSSGGSLGKRVQ
jgi:hypothetical protein